MPIYIQTGTGTSSLKMHNAEDSFKWLVEYQPVKYDGRLDSFKQKKAKYFISGYIEPNDNGSFTRNDDNLIRRSLIIMDYDDMTISDNEFLNIIQEKLQTYNYITYPSVSNNMKGKGTRYRLILQPDRPLVDYEYKYMIKQVSDLVGIKLNDNSNYTWSQPQGLPAVKAKESGKYKVTVNHGDKFPVPKIGEIPLPPKKEYKFSGTKSTSGKLSQDEAIKMIKAYVDVDAKNLTDYTNALSAVMVIAKAVMYEEIDHDTAVEACKIIALGDADWADGNVNKLYRILELGIEPRTTYTFKQKFHDLFFKEADSLDDLKKRLKLAGEKWRIDHEKLNETTGETTVFPADARAVADIMLKVCKCVLINEDDPELSPLAIYDPSEGIYKKGLRFIYNLALTVERTLSELACKQVIHFLTNDDKCKEVERTIDSNLIVCNNGVYDRSKKKLLPFSDKWIFINKISTDYVAGAKEPFFDDWNFTKWIKQLSDGQLDKELLFYQMFYSAINANYVSEVAFFLVSEKGRTSKGTVQELLRNLVGNRNTSNLKLKEFESDFKISTVYGKSLILGDDNNPKDFNQTSENFKSVVTGDGILLNGKFVKLFNTKLTPTVIQSMNGIPRFSDTTDGFTRRLRIIEFKHTFKGADNNRKVKDIYVKDKRLHQYILAKVIDMDVYDIVNTEESKKLVEDLVLDNNPIMLFFKEVITDLESERLPSKFLFNYFQAWCISENNPTKIKQRTFTKQLREILEPIGWEYEPKNGQALFDWKQSDIDKYSKLRDSCSLYLSQWDINVSEERYRQQGLFIKRTS